MTFPSFAGASFSHFLNLVPLYDGRKAMKSFVHQLKYIAGPGSELKPYGRDVPDNSIVIVGYTVNTWGKSPEPSSKHVSFNIHWVIVMATPEDTELAAETYDDPDLEEPESVEREAEAEEAEAEDDEEVFKGKAVVKGKGKKRA